MGKRLYVGNLPYDADESTLRTAFTQDGRIVERVHIVLDRETQRPRGFAFIEMASDEQAKAAIAAMDGAVFGMRQLRVTEAEERRPGGGPGGPGGPRGPGAPARPMGAGGGAPRPTGGGFAPRTGDGGRNFGPDARPKSEREREMEQRRKSQKPKQRESGPDDGGRRGSSRFDDDEEE